LVFPVLPECSGRIRERGCSITGVFLVRFLSHVLHLLISCVHLLVCLFGIICVKNSTFYGFHQSLRFATFRTHLEIALGMCSIQACFFQIASGGFWSCNFLACIGKFVTCYSSPNFLCSSFGVVNRIVLCTFLQRDVDIVINRAAHVLSTRCTFGRRTLFHSELSGNPQF
jgi:hypothetical protein